MDEDFQTDQWPRMIRSNAKSAVVGIWLFSGFWNLVSWPVLFAIPGEVEGGNMAALAALMFPLIGLCLVYVAVKKTKEWRRFGVTQLRLDPYPGAIGGHVGGIVDLSGSRIDRSTQFEVTLECIHSRLCGSGSDRSRRNTVRWQARGPAEMRVDGKLEFRFDVPAQLPASEPKEGDSYDFWQVRLENDQSAIALDRTFEIGVFPTAELARDVTVDTSARGRKRADVELSGALADSQHAEKLRTQHGLTVERRGQWLRLYLHRGRQKGLAAGLGVAGAIFATAGFLIPDEGFVTELMRWLFGVAGWGMLLASVYIPFNSLDVRINRNEIRRIRGWFGMVVKQEKIAPDELTELAIAQGSTVTAGSKTTIYYRLIGKGPFGEFRIAETIADRSLVEALRRQVMAAAGLSGLENQ